MGDDPEFSTTVKLQRGSGTDDRDTIKVQVSAGTIDALDRRVTELRDHMEAWADDFRDVQPEQSRRTSEDQSELGAVKS